MKNIFFILRVRRFQLDTLQSYYFNFLNVILLTFPVFHFSFVLFRSSLPISSRMLFSIVFYLLPHSSFSRILSPLIFYLLWYSIFFRGMSPLLFYLRHYSTHFVSFISHSVLFPCWFSLISLFFHSSLLSSLLAFLLPCLPPLHSSFLVPLSPCTPFFYVRKGRSSSMKNSSVNMTCSPGDSRKCRRPSCSITWSPSRSYREDISVIRGVRVKR